MKRCTDSLSSDSLACMTLMATRSFRVSCAASNTAPMPPIPIRRVILYLPTLDPINGCGAASFWGSALIGFQGERQLHFTLISHVLECRRDALPLYPL